MKTQYWITACIIIASALGCSDSATPPDSTSSTSENRSQFLVDIEPADAIGVGAARQSAESGEQITLVGRIGGSHEPFVEGIAAFTIVDESVPYCSDDEGCRKPWDYCCKQDQVKVNIATIKVVDESGSPVSSDARQLLGVKELSMVVIQGQVTRDEEGNLSVSTKQVFVRPNKG